MEHYVTLFDSLFLPQGLALHASLERHAEPFMLWVLCLDETTYHVLTRLKKTNIHCIYLAEVETEELRQVKSGRSRAEYCWTLTPFAPRFVFEKDQTVRRVTYVDADFWLRKSSAPIFLEMDASGKAVLITDHAYAPEYDQTATYGQFCVQFMIFERNAGEPVRKWWEERCIEWCFARFEEGKFGDQKYLDDWPDRFPDLVHVLSQVDLILAPWNVTRFPYGRAVAFHFHGLRIMQGNRVLLGSDYPLPFGVVQYIYIAYLEDLRRAIKTIQSLGVPVRPQTTVPSLLKRLTLFFRGIYHARWRWKTRKVVSF